MEMKERKSFFTNFLFLCLGIIISIIIIYIFRYQIGGLFSSNKSDNGTCYTACENTVSITENGISAAVEKIYDAVVLVKNYKNNKLYGTGTGFVYKVDNKYGYLLTNYHVISGNSTIKIVLSNGEEVTAQYLGGDNYLDIAILTIPKEKVLKVAKIGNSNNSKLGDTVFTIGTPVGLEYSGTVTRGILSGKDRLVNVTDDNNNQIVMKVLQTDAAMNPGNSGGPLVNINGEVIGINSLKLVQDEIEGMGFSIAIEDITIHMESLEKGEKIKRPYLGISMINISDKTSLLKAGIKVSESINSGVVVATILDNASVKGILLEKDIITKINGKAVKNAAYLRYELYKYKIGEEITITFIRDDKPTSEKIVLKEAE